MFLAIMEYFKKVNSYISLFNLLVFSSIAFVTLLIVDYRDFPSKIIEYVSVNVVIIMSALIVFLLLIWAIKDKLKNYLTMPIPIALDCFLIVLFISCLLYGTYTLVFEWDFSIKICLCLIILIFSLVILGIRILYVSAEQTDSIVSQNVYDLKDVYENIFSYNKQGPILLKEDAVDYDLLNRRSIINLICSTIESCRHSSSFVVGLEGDWGSGKTTVINNVKQKLKKNDNIVIDDFDPWLYGSQEALLLAMLDTILEHSGVKYGAIKIRSIVNELIDTVAENYKVGSLVKTFIGKYNKANITGIKERINSYLNIINKNIVFIIDNIDRAEAANIIFLFKLIGNVFDLPRIVYVLSYDKNRLNTVFENTLDIDRKYMEKIIQQEISIPQIQIELLHNLYFTCIRNILRQYGILDDEFLEYFFINKCICQKVKDIRNLKRIINSSFSTTFFDKTILNRKDLLSIEVIKFTEPDLYNLIYQNRCFFITYDKDYDIDRINTFFGNQDFNEKGKNFFEQLFYKYPEYKEILKDMFPYVDRYILNQDLENDSYSNENYSDIFLNARICSAKFFDLYFSYGSNRNLMIEKDISETINNIYNMNSPEEVEEYIYKKINFMDAETQRYWFEGLQLSFPKFRDDVKDKIITAVFSNMNSIDNSKDGYQLNASERAFLVVTNYICSGDCSIVEKLCKTHEKKYNCMMHLLNLYQKLHKMPENSEFCYKKKKLNILNRSIREMCLNVSTEHINLYCEPHYTHGNIWVLKIVLEDYYFKKYIENVSRESNIYRILYDTINFSSSKYQIKASKFYNMFSDKSAVDNIILRNPPETESEMFVYNVYKNFAHRGKEISIVMPEDFML